MSEIEYSLFDDVNLKDMMGIANQDSLREHLIDHPYFDIINLKAWIDEKIRLNSKQGCRIRVVYIGGELAGWCGIQPDDKGFELAIAIAKKFWGFGIPIFKTLMCWASDLGHKEVSFHLLESRPQYKALNRMSTKVQKTKQLGRCFTSYYIPVGK